MGHNANTNYTVSQSITTENAGDSVSTGTLPNQAGNGSVVLTITPNTGFTVNSSDFTIGGIAADNTTNVTSTTLTNPATGNALSVVQYQFFSPSVGGNNTVLPSQVESVTMFNSEYDYDATANSYIPVTANNLVYVYVYFNNNFVMPNTNLTLNIDIDGSANTTNALRYPAVWETWTGPTGSDYTLTVVGNPLLSGMNLISSSTQNTKLHNISGIVDDGVRTLLMTKTFTATSGRYFTDITEQEHFTAFGLVDWLPYFEANITSQVFNTNGEETERVIEYYYTNPPVGNPQGLDPTFGGNTYGYGFLFEYIVGTQATVYPLTGGGTGGIAPLAPQPPFTNLTTITSSAELGDVFEDINPAVTTIPSTEFFGEIKNIVFDTDKEINAIGGESRPIAIYGTAGATYNIVVSDGSNTYDDSSNTFTAGATQIDGEVGSEGVTNHLVVFPRVTSTKTYTTTISSEFGTKLPSNITDGESGNIGSITSNATRTFTIAFASASKISAAMPADIVFSFADLDSAATGNNTFKVIISGDVNEEFSNIDAFTDAPDAITMGAMSVTSGSATNWQWGLSGVTAGHTEGITDQETGIDTINFGGTLVIQNLGDANVEYTIQLDTLFNVS